MVAPQGVQVPSALVRKEEEVMVPLTNYSNKRLTVGIRRVIAILDEAASATEEIEPEPVPADEPEPGIAMPPHMEELCDRSIETLEDSSDRQQVRELLHKYQDIFVGEA